MRKARRLSSLVRRSEGIALVGDVNLDLIVPDHQTSSTWPGRTVPVPQALRRGS
ncbi:MAG TPA: hypothetical protein VE288_18425 [Rubrobacteraceae bacterium]|nr:hypothetical protein [Rubrobacteraceae bacterium]